MRSSPRAGPCLRRRHPGRKAVHHSRLWPRARDREAGRIPGRRASVHQRKLAGDYADWDFFLARPAVAIENRLTTLSTHNSFAQVTGAERLRNFFAEPRRFPS